MLNILNAYRNLLVELRSELDGNEDITICLEDGNHLVIQFIGQYGCPAKQIPAHWYHMSESELKKTILEWYQNFKVTKHF